MSKLNLTHIQYLRSLLTSDKLTNNYEEQGMHCRIAQNKSMHDFTEEILTILDQLEGAITMETVECPYCKHENDMSDGLTDLPSDNKFDHECTGCQEEFEVFVEFEPSYSAGKIIYTKCERCGKEERDICRRRSIFPYPKTFTENEICRGCWHEGLRIDFSDNLHQ